MSRGASFTRYHRSVVRPAPAILAVASLAALGALAFADGGPTSVPAAPPTPPAPYVPSPERGYRTIVDRAFVTPALDDAVFDDLWTSWPEEARARAERTSKEERRRLALARYGLTPREDDPSKPLQFVVDEKGKWSINCFACHTGQLEGRTVAGRPNADFAFQDLMDDVQATASKTGRLATAAVAALWRRFPLGATHGTTNSVVFGVALGVFRDPEMNFRVPKETTPFVHHDLDAPPFWNVKTRPWLYVDGGAKKGHRWLMQFAMVPSNGPERFREWDDTFRDVLAYVESVPVPKWSRPLDAALAAKGRVVFEKNCSTCHGTYGATVSYPSITVPIDVVMTDATRLHAIPKSERERFANSWLSSYRPEDVVVDPTGYLAPPLSGVFASAPYFHNGSAPTLWHVLHPAARPKAWRKKSASAYDSLRVGLDVEERDSVPADLSPYDRRSWFDTSLPGKSSSGHDFPAALPEPDLVAVLEYLKTL